MNINSFSKWDKILNGFKSLGSNISGFFLGILMVFSLPFLWLYENMNFLLILWIGAIGGWIFSLYMNFESSGIFLLVVIIGGLISGIFITDDVDELFVFMGGVLIIFGYLGYYHGGKVKSVEYVDTNKTYMKDIVINGNTIEYIGGDEMTHTISLSGDTFKHYKRFKDSGRFASQLKVTTTTHPFLDYYNKETNSTKVIEQTEELYLYDTVAKKALFTIQ